MSSQRSISAEASQDNIRKRVSKACDRCRLKKSKCDGASLCSRCKANNAVCVFGKRKKSQDKIYPKGYAEMLEQQQKQLVAGLRELYGRLQSGQGWPGQPLREAQGGHPLTHDIIERLNLLYLTSEGSINYEGLEENGNRMQQKLLKRGAPYKHRRGSVSFDSEHCHTSPSSSYSGTPTTRSIPFSDPFVCNNAPPIPCMYSPFSRQSQIFQQQPLPPIKQEAPMASSAFVDAGALDPSALSRSAWASEPMMLDEPLDFSKSMPTFDSYNAFDQNAMALEPMVMGDPVNSMMLGWNNANDLDFSRFIHDPAGA